MFEEAVTVEGGSPRSFPREPGLLLQHLREGGQGVAGDGGSEPGHRLGAHGGQLQPVAQLDDAFVHDAVVRHRPIPAAAGLSVSRLVDLQVGRADQGAPELPAAWAFFTWWWTISRPGWWGPIP